MKQWSVILIACLLIAACSSGEESNELYASANDGMYNRQNEMCLFAKTKCVCFFLLKIIHNMNKKEQNQCFTVCFPLKNPTI